MIAEEEKEDVVPVCPHCKHMLSTIWCRRIQAFLGRKYVYFCPGCRSCLGVSHRKGFWMG